MELATYIKWMELYHAKVVENKTLLTDLDTPIGDADHGNNMVRGMNAVMEALEKDQPEDLASAIKVTAKNLLSKVGGSAGPLYGSAFLGMAKGLAGNDNFNEAIKQGAEAIKQRGKSTIGEKTMVDVWDPAADQLVTAELTKEFIQEAVEATKPMKATKGRASYVGERSIGHIDPGAYSSGLLFEALLEAKEQV